MMDYATFVKQLTPGDYHVPRTTDEADMMHAALGISTEAGEILDVFKKAYAYNKPIDFVNLDEEMGDVLWYIQLYANARGKTIEQFIEMNQAKLFARYGDKFSTEKALNRDLVKEREVLEQD